MLDLFNTYDDLRELFQEPKWKVPVLYAMTDEALIQELQRRGYIGKKERFEDNADVQETKSTTG